MQCVIDGIADADERKIEGLLGKFSVIYQDSFANLNLILFSPHTVAAEQRQPKSLSVDEIFSQPG